MHGVPFRRASNFVMIATALMFVLLRSLPSVAQTVDYAALEARLAHLEQRQAALEQENQLLRQQVDSLTETLQQSVAVSQPAALQTPTPPQAAAAAPAPEALPQRVQFGGDIRFRPESRSSFNPKSNVNIYLLQRIRLNANMRLNENVTGLIQVQDSRLWGQEVSTASNEANLDLHQGYLQVAKFLGPHATLRIGRQELSYGNQRLLGAFEWDNVGRSFDAGKLMFSGPKWSADLFAGRAIDRRNSNRGDGSQDLIGLYARVGRPNAKVGVEPYLLYLRDGQEIAGEITGATRAPTRILTLGFRQFGTVGSGFGWNLENAFQVGQRGPDTQRAAALAAQGHYRFGNGAKPEFGFEYDYATGDGKSTDGKANEFNNLFPTNHLLYGYADYLGWRNMQDFKPYVSLQLRSNVRAEFSYHRFLLVEKTGAWKNAGGTVLGYDPSGKLGTDLGHEIDATVAFPIYEHLRMLPGYSLFIPGKFARGTQGPRASQFVYWQTLVSF